MAGSQFGVARPLKGVIPAGIRRRPRPRDSAARLPRLWVNRGRCGGGEDSDSRRGRHVTTSRRRSQGHATLATGSEAVGLYLTVVIAAEWHEAVYRMKTLQVRRPTLAVGDHSGVDVRGLVMVAAAVLGGVFVSGMGAGLALRYLVKTGLTRTSVLGLMTLAVGSLCSPTPGSCSGGPAGGGNECGSSPPCSCPC